MQNGAEMTLLQIIGAALIFGPTFIFLLWGTVALIRNGDPETAFVGVILLGIIVGGALLAVAS